MSSARTQHCRLQNFTLNCRYAQTQDHARTHAHTHARARAHSRTHARMHACIQLASSCEYMVGNTGSRCHLLDPSHAHTPLTSVCVCGCMRACVCACACACECACACMCSCGCSCARRVHACVHGARLLLNECEGGRAVQMCAHQQAYRWHVCGM